MPDLSTVFLFLSVSLALARASALLMASSMAFNRFKIGGVLSLFYLCRKLLMAKPETLSFNAALLLDTHYPSFRDGL